MKAGVRWRPLSRVLLLLVSAFGVLLLIYYSSGGRREVPTVSTPWFASVPNWIRSTEPPTPTPSEALFIAATEEVLPESFVDDELMLQMKEYVYQPLKPVQHPTSRPLTVTECVAKLASTAINDGYCDCPDDGSDEPDTSACLMGRFLCSKGVAIPSAWVDDGVCDCCNGRDERGRRPCAQLRKCKGPSF